MGSFNRKMFVARMRTNVADRSFWMGPTGRAAIRFADILFLSLMGLKGPFSQSENHFRYNHGSRKAYRPRGDASEGAYDANCPYCA